MSVFDFDQSDESLNVIPHLKKNRHIHKKQSTISSTDSFFPVRQKMVINAQNVCHDKHSLCGLLTLTKLLRL